MESLRSATALAAAAFLLSAGVAAASETTTVRMMISPSGSGPYNAFATMQTHMEEFSETLRLSVEETPGFNFNVKYMATQPDRYSNTVFGSGSVLDWVAETGLQPFYPEPLEVMSEFRTIAVLGLSYNVWVTMDPEIQTPEDFGGKSVGIGMLTQNEWGMHQRMLLDGWGLTPELASLDMLGTGPNIDALLDGRTEVGTLFGLTSAGGEHTVVTGPHRQLEASGRDWHYVQVPETMIEDYVAKTGAPFRVVEYEAGTLPNQPYNLTTFGDLLLLKAHQSFPEEAAYELARVLVENYDQISGYSAFVAAWTPETLAYGAAETPELFHPGALKAYRELGIVN